MRWLLLLFFLSGSLQADVKVSVKATTHFLGESELTSVSYYAGDRSTEESTIQWKSGIMKTIKGGKPKTTITITRLDNELVWTVNPKKKRYTEMTFAEYREQRAKEAAEMEKAQAEETAEEEEAVEEPSEDAYEWTVENLSDPDPRTINGFECRNLKLVTTGTHKEEPRDKVWIMLDNWNCPDVPGTDEIAAFQMRYMKALGVDEVALNFGLKQAMAAYQSQFEALGEHSEGAPGRPVLSTVEYKRNQQVGPSLKKRAGDAAVKGLTGKLPFGMKKKSKPEEPRWEEKLKFRAVTELLEVSTDPIGADIFEVPEGYKKKKKKK